MRQLGTQKHRADDPAPRQRGKVVSDDPANHDLNDDKGARARRADDPATHDVNDVNGSGRPRHSGRKISGMIGRYLPTTP
jgi:hypothetical protein